MSENAGSKAGATKFQPGRSGNPRGKPKGTRHKATQAMEALFDGEAEALTRKAIAMALDGDQQCLRMAMDRIAPARKDRHVIFELPSIVTASDAVAASSAVVSAAAEGLLTPSEAVDLGRLIEAHVRVIEVGEIEERLSKLENRVSQ